MQASQSSGSRHVKLASLTPEERLAELEIQIADVRQQKSLLEAGKSGRVYSPPTDYSKKPKKSFHHPKLDFVYGEIIYSPYLTPPLEQYPETTFTMVEELRELKRKGTKKISKLPKEKRPFNTAWARNTFIREVVNYKVSYVPKGSEKKQVRRASRQTGSAGPSI